MPRKYTLILLLLSLLVRFNDAYTVGNHGFSLSSYRTARAKETSGALDASRFHFQILLVDNNNFHARIAEGILSRVVEYNDALFTLFPASTTILNSSLSSSKGAAASSVSDASAPDTAMAVCESLDLCPVNCAALGSSFDMDLLDEYDLIIATNEETHSLILRSLPEDDYHQNYYAPKCRVLSEFLSLNFCNIHHQQKYHSSSSGSSNNDQKENHENADTASLLNMLDPEFRERAEPFYEMVKDQSSQILASSLSSITPDWRDIYSPRMVAVPLPEEDKSGVVGGGGGGGSSSGDDSVTVVPNPNGWPLVEAAILVATGGITRFCLDTMDAQFETALSNLLSIHFCRAEHLTITFDQADEQLRRGSHSITGYFSPQQRREMFEKHLSSLRQTLE